MVFGRITHYAFDAVLVSTVLAGIKRTSGFAPDSSLIPDETMRTAANSFLRVGESIFDIAQGMVVNSSYFKRDSSSSGGR